MLDVQLSCIFLEKLEAIKIIVAEFSLYWGLDPSSSVTSSILLHEVPCKIPATSNAGIAENDVMLMLSLCLLFEIFMCMCIYISVPHILVEFESFTLIVRISFYLF